MMESAQPDDPFADPSVTTAQDVHVEIGNAPAESHSLLDDDPPAKTAAPTAAAAAAEPQPAAAAAVPANTFCGCFSVAYYKPFFDVDTEDIQARIKTVAIPERDIEKHAFLQLAADRPDMYGPFWICTTLVFSMAVTSNFASWWAFKGTPALWTYDFSKIVSAASLIYGYQVIMPVAVWFIGRYLATPITVTQTLCLFGYSTLAFIPATVLCTLVGNLWLLQWLAMLAATAHSMFFIIANLWRHLHEHMGAKALPVLGTIAAAHLIFWVSLKFVFF